MKPLLTWLLLLPIVAAGQLRTYYSGDLSVHFAKSLEHTGYGIHASGNMQAVDKVFVGLTAGAVQVKPFVSNPAFVLNGRLTFFTSRQEEKLVPFGLFEVGKLFYNEQNFGGQPSQQLEGGLNFFTGVGVRFSAKKLHPFFSIGYAGFHYNNNTYRNNAVEFTRPYRFRRMEIKLGLMLPK